MKQQIVAVIFVVLWAAGVTISEEPGEIYFA
jgi:hypothetical protein